MQIKINWSTIKMYGCSWNKSLLVSLGCFHTRAFGANQSPFVTIVQFVQLVWEVCLKRWSGIFFFVRTMVQFTVGVNVIHSVLQK